MPEENLRVAVRVRPFNKRERARNATLIVEMNGKETVLTDPEGQDEPRKFAFDHSYWSFDGSKEQANGYYGPDPSHPNGKKFCDQDTVFQDLGVGVLKNAWEGFNSTLFAYGQTGSGKSWSVVGYGINKGIVPRLCELIFTQIDEKKASGGDSEFQVLFGMLEIYNEEVRDLLVDKNPRGGLKVRENPKLGFYAQGVKTLPVADYPTIEAKMAEGTANRTVASTNMNATSSRAHTIVTITFIQKYKNAAGAETEKKAVCNLVDLAGSERADSTGATGARLKEGAAINQSLSSLGNCIAALADQSSGKSVRVPYRDSVLTKLLKNALGGNSKTVMIAAVSPADINYDESLSTLRYADRAKQIKTVAVVNEDPTEKLIRELQEENERLKTALESGGIVIPEGDGTHGLEKSEGMSKADEESMKKELAEEYEAAMKANEEKMAEMQRSYEEMLKQQQEADKGKVQQQKDTADKKSTHDYITNINMDQSMSGFISHFIKESGETTVGNKRGNVSDICLKGPSLLENHAVITVENGKVYIEKTVAAARVLVNGNPALEKTELNHLDRLMFGTTQLYTFINHKEKNVVLPDFSDAMEEIAGSAGLDLETEGKSADELVLRDDVVDILPLIEEANSLSEEMDKKILLDPLIVPAEAHGSLRGSGKPKLFVHVKNQENDLEDYWTKEEFYARYAIMENLFTRFDDDDDDFNGNMDQATDPFMIDEKDDIHVGSFKVFLECMSYNIEMVEQLDVVDYQSEQIGVCMVEIHPCTAKGKIFKPEDDVFVDDPEQLLGQAIHFKLKITGVQGLPKKYKDIYAKFRLRQDVEPVVTKVAKGNDNPKWNYEKVYSFTELTPAELEYLKTGHFMVQIWAKQSPVKKGKINTKELIKKKKAAQGETTINQKRVKKKVDPNASGVQQEAMLAKKKFTKFQKRVGWLKDLLRAANKRNKVKVPTSLVIAVLEAKNQKEARQIINRLNKTRGGGTQNLKVKCEKSKEPAKSEKPENSEKLAESEKTSELQIPANSENMEKSEKAADTKNLENSEKPAGSEKPLKLEKPEKIAKSAKTAEGGHDSRSSSRSSSDSSPSSSSSEDEDDIDISQTLHDRNITYRLRL